MIHIIIQETEEAGLPTWRPPTPQSLSFKTSLQETMGDVTHTLSVLEM